MLGHDPSRHRLTRSIFTLLFVLGLLVAPAGATAAPRSASTQFVAAAPDWMSAETAAALALSFDVLVPSWIPGPFSGEPSVYATGGYYSLYWVVYGGAPTFLEIAGEVGGDIPDGSAYDLNAPLVVNADVQGYPAFRDLTPIYDTVWWRVGSIVYSVSSQNMTGADSLSLANALVALVPPAGSAGDGDVQGDTGGAPELAPAIWPPASVGGGETATVWVEGSGVRLDVDGGFFEATGNASYPDAGGLGVVWRSPAVEGERIVTFVLTDEITGQQVAVAETVVHGDANGDQSDPLAENSPANDADETMSVGAGTPREDAESASQRAAPLEITLVCPPVVYSGRLAPVRLSGQGDVVIDASHGGWPDEPGNRQFDEAANGSPALDGSPSNDDHVFLHWRAPLVRSILQVTVSALGPGGEELASCQTNVRPGPLPNAGDAETNGDGSGGPFPLGPLMTNASDEPDEIGNSDGSGGPTGSTPDDGTAGPVDDLADSG